MSLYTAIQSLRAQAAQHRIADFGVNEEHMEAARIVLGALDRNTLAAIRSAWAAEVLDRAADGLESIARSDVTVVARLKP